MLTLFLETCRKVARDLSMPNGIAVSPNGEKVAVSSTTISTVFLYERREDNRLRLREHVKAVSFLIQFQLCIHHRMPAFLANAA